MRAAKHVPRTASDMVDVHWAFLDAEAGLGWRCELPIDDLPATKILLLACMKVLPNPSASDSGSDEYPESLLKKDALNIIVRRYNTGNKLKWHKDSIGLFDDAIYGVVLCAGGKGLCFKHGFRRYDVPEQPGVCSLSTEDSRFDWAHGVEAGDGGRVSVTWRWFRKSYIRWEEGSATLRSCWICRFLAFASACGIPSTTAEAFLLHLDEPRDEHPWLFKSKNDACGPQLSWKQLQKHRTRGLQILNKCGGCREPPPEVVAVAKNVKWLEAESGPGLDPRVLPFLRLWEASEPREEPQPPRDEVEADFQSGESHAMSSMGLPMSFGQRGKRMGSPISPNTKRQRV
eukprot:gnl/MRDRNA2_/MRDRNA2_187512_c0_seq1.p1 gnl/MRDRNA2_/MRDRNA2_187512_c0~~gnl/MRDRNA2_/MRDRNA2_187512_c0_seq1.p1  ORF type:complete len:398 (+),score=80.18 gnl/MRDRNA2_/MRDRNA2_187512_c0_seq1:164-1195(+)